MNGFHFLAEVSDAHLIHLALTGRLTYIAIIITAIVTHHHFSHDLTENTITMAALFTIPIAPLGEHPGGEIVCTSPKPKVYLLTFSSPPDNRITTPFCRALLSALDVLEFGGYAPGVLITTSAIQKFYSNGLDLAHAIETEGFWALLYSVWSRFLT